MTIQQQYEAWTACPAMPGELLEDLRSMNEEAKNDAFYRDLAFGTGGLRGVLGAGTNRMNFFTVLRATRGLGSYLKETYAQPSAALSCDSRIHSRDFVELTAAALVRHGGVQIPVAQHHRAARQRREDGLGHVLGPRRRVQ